MQRCPLFRLSFSGGSTVVELYILPPVLKQSDYFSLSPAVTEPIYGGQLARDYLEKRVNPVLVQGLTELCKQKPEDAVVCSASLQPFLSRAIMQNQQYLPHLVYTCMHT